jgi:hypothetical protein
MEVELMAHMLRTRLDDKSPWSEPMAFQNKRERDNASARARAWAGIRTHSWTETKAEEAARLAREADPCQCNQGDACGPNNCDFAPEAK